MHVTMRQIAQEVGVSRVAVSHVVNGREHELSSATCEKIRQALKKYDYQPNALVRGIQNQRSDMVGVIVPGVHVSFFPDILNALEKDARLHGYQCLLCQSHASHDILAQEVTSFREHRLDGMIICPVDASEHHDFYEGLLKHHVPFVLIDCGDEGIEAPIVTNDNVACGYLATKHLLDLGHRRIGCIKGPRMSFVARERFEGYCKALSEAGVVRDPLLVTNDRDYGEGKQYGVAALLDKALGMTGVVTFTDINAADSIDQLQQKGLRVPQDISVVGCANLDFGHRMTPKLTTIDQKPDQIAQKAWELLQTRIKQPNATVKQARIVPELIVRDSTSRCPS